LQFEGSGRYSPALQGVPGSGASGEDVVGGFVIAAVVIEGCWEVVVVVEVAVVVVVGCGVVVVVGRGVVVVVVGGCHHGGKVVIGLEVTVVVVGGCHQGGVADVVGLTVVELELVVQSGQVEDEEVGGSFDGVELISPTN
jgi:hypothetical protein